MSQQLQQQQPQQQQSKGYSFGMRLPDNMRSKSSTPSPLDYSTSSFTRFGKVIIFCQTDYY